MSVYGLTSTDVARLKRLLNSFEHGDFKRQSFSEKSRQRSPIETYLAEVYGDPIPANDTEVGTGMAQLRFFNPGDNQISQKEVEIKVFNVYPVEIPVGSLVVCVRETLSGWYCILTFCPQGEEMEDADDVDYVLGKDGAGFCKWVPIAECGE